MNSDRRSNTIIAISAAAIILFLFIVWFITPPSDLSRVPPQLTSGEEEAFQRLLSGHINPPPQGSRRFLLISSFMRPSIAQEYFIADSGEEEDRRDVWNWAIQDKSFRQLTAEDMNDLRLALSQLPKSTDDPPIDRLVVISFWNAKKWTTRSYDSESLPEPMSRVFSIIRRRPNRMGELLEKWLNEHPEITDQAKQ